MSLLAWIIQFCCQSFIYKWIISWGGAQQIEGWKAGLMLEWFAWNWNVEQIRFYVSIIWIISAIWFVLGIFIPSLRF